METHANLVSAWPELTVSASVALNFGFPFGLLRVSKSKSGRVLPAHSLAVHTCGGFFTLMAACCESKGTDIITE